MNDQNQKELSLHGQLSAMVSRYHYTTFIAHGLKSIVVLGLLVLSFCTIDFFINLPLIGREYFTYTFYTFSLFVIFWFLVKPFLNAMTHERMAWHLENTCKNFDESLISALNFEKDSSGQHSNDMKQKVIDDAEASLHQVHPLVIFRVSKSIITITLGAVVIYLAFYIGFTPNSNILLKRVLWPSAYDARPGSFILEQLQPDKDYYIEGENLKFQVRVIGRSVDNVKLILRQNTERSIEMTWIEEQKIYECQLNNLVGDLWFRFQAEEVSTTEKKMYYKAQPKIDRFEITYQYPTYTGLPQKTVKSISGDIQATVGTNVLIKTFITKRLASHEINWLNQKEIKSHPSPGVLNIDFNRNIEKDGDYQISFTDQDQIQNTQLPKYKVIAFPDKKPIVNFIAIDSEIYIKAKAPLDLEWLTEDDFGILSQTLIAKNSNGTLLEQGLDKNSTQTSLDIPKLNLKDGDHFNLQLRVKDQHHTVYSETIKVNIVDDEHVQFALPFAKKCEELVLEYQKLRNHFLKTQSSIDLIQGFTPDNVSQDQNERHHQLGVQSIRLQENKLRLEELLHKTEDLQNMAFFPESQRGLNLKERYLYYLNNHELSQLIDHPEKSKPMEKLILSTQLNINLLERLKDRAHQHHDQFEMKRLNKLKELDDKTFQEIKNKYFNKAYYHNTLPKAKPQNGLNARYYYNKKSYPTEVHKSVPLPKADKEFVSKTINYDNMKKFGWNHHQIFSASYYGFIKVPKSQKIKFYLTSDDGSRLSIDNRVLIYNDGSHGMQERSKELYLSAGYHFIEIQYFNSSGEGGLKWSWSFDKQVKTIVPEHVLKSSLSDKEYENFVNNSLTSEIDRLIKNNTQIDQAIKAIKDQIPENQLDLNQTLADIELGKEESWDEVEALKEHLDTLAERTDDEELSDTQESAADLLAGIIEKEDIDKLKKFNEMLNNADTVEEKGETFLAPTEKEKLSQIQPTTSELLALAKEQLKPIPKSLEKALQELAKAKNSLQNELSFKLQENKTQDESILGDMALLKSMEKNEEQLQELASQETIEPEPLKSLEQELANTEKLAQDNEAQKKEQLSQKEETIFNEKVNDLLEELATKEEQQQLKHREQLHSLQKDTMAMQEQSEQLTKRHDSNGSKDLAQQAKQTEEKVKALSEGKSIESKTPETTLNEDTKTPNASIVAQQLSQLKQKLNEANSLDQKQQTTKSISGKLKSKALDSLNKVDQTDLDHQQDEAFQKAMATAQKKNMQESSQALRQFADKMKHNSPLYKDLKHQSEEMQKHAHHENQLKHEKNQENQKLKELDQKVQDLKHELSKKPDALSRKIQNALNQSKESAENGDYEDAQKSLKAAQKDTLEWLKPKESSIANVDNLKKDALQNLQDAERQANKHDKAPIKNIKDDVQNDKLASALENLKPLIESKKEDLKRYQKAKALAQAQKVKLPKYKEAERDVKSGKLTEAAFKIASVDPTNQLADDLLKLQQDKENLLSQLGQEKANQLDSDVRKSLDIAIIKGNSGDYKSLYRELAKNKKELQDFVQTSSELQAREKKMEASIKKEESQINNEIKQGQRDLKESYDKEIRKLSQETKSEKDQIKKKQLEQEMKSLQHLQRESQHKDLAHVKNKIHYQLKGVAELEEAQAQLKQAETLQNESPEPESIANVGETEKGELSKAQQSLEKAQVPLEQGKANKESSNNFQNAAESLSNALAKLDEALLAGMSSESPSLAAAASASQESSDDSTEPTQGDNFKLDPDFEKNLESSSDWNGLDGNLKKQGGQSKENNYDDYFTQANHRYLQKIMKESRKWK